MPGLFYKDVSESLYIGNMGTIQARRQGWAMGGNFPSIRKLIQHFSG